MVLKQLGLRTKLQLVRCWSAMPGKYTRLYALLQIFMIIISNVKPPNNLKIADYFQGYDYAGSARLDLGKLRISDILIIINIVLTHV